MPAGRRGTAEPHWQKLPWQSQSHRREDPLPPKRYILAPQPTNALVLAHGGWLCGAPTRPWRWKRTAGRRTLRVRRRDKARPGEPFVRTRHLVLPVWWRWLAVCCEQPGRAALAREGPLLRALQRGGVSEHPPPSKSPLRIVPNGVVGSLNLRRR